MIKQVELVAHKREKIRFQHCPPRKSDFYPLILLLRKPFQCNLPSHSFLSMRKQTQASQQRLHFLDLGFCRFRVSIAGTIAITVISITHVESGMSAKTSHLIQFFWDDSKPATSVAISIIAARNLAQTINSLENREAAKPLTPEGGTRFQTTVELGEGLFYYLFLIDNESWRYGNNTLSRL